MDKKYKCFSCNISFDYNSHYEIHLNSNKHKNYGRKKIHYCYECEYETKYKDNLRFHLFHHHCSEKERKKYCEYYCTICKNIHKNLKSYETHCNTNKHKKLDAKKNKKKEQNIMN